MKSFRELVIKEDRARWRLESAEGERCLAFLGTENKSEDRRGSL